MLSFLLILLFLGLRLTTVENAVSFKLTPEEKKLIQAYRLRNAYHINSTSSLITSLAPLHKEQCLEWVMSENLTKWYTKFDLCMLNYSSSDVTIEEMTNNCTKAAKELDKLENNHSPNLLPTRCRAGNAWPLKSAYCSPSDLAFSDRINFRK